MGHRTDSGFTDDESEDEDDQSSEAGEEETPQREEDLTSEDREKFATEDRPESVRTGSPPYSQTPDAMSTAHTLDQLMDHETSVFGAQGVPDMTPGGDIDMIHHRQEKLCVNVRRLAHVSECFREEMMGLIEAKQTQLLSQIGHQLATSNGLSEEIGGVAEALSKHECTATHGHAPNP